MRLLAFITGRRAWRGSCDTEASRRSHPITLRPETGPYFKSPVVRRRPGAS